VSGLFYLSGFPLLTSLSLPQLAQVGAFEIDDDGGVNILLTSVDVPLLVTISTDTLCSACPGLKSFNAPLWVPTDGTTITFNGDALDGASVELILSRCVLAGVTTCTIDLSGGVNAGLLSLGAQGQLDAATLGAQLTINP
jgi:hypothetical protein